jgi:TetR/AcrR family transcriptional regulator
MSTRDTGTEQLIRDTAKHLFFAEGKLHATTQEIADAAGGKPHPGELLFPLP